MSGGSCLKILGKQNQIDIMGEGEFGCPPEKFSKLRALSETMSKLP